MSAVHDVDPRVIERTRNWLIGHNSSPLEAGNPTPTSSTKARPIASTPTWLESPLTSHGRLKPLAMMVQPSTKHAPFCVLKSRTHPRSWTRMPSQYSPTLQSTASRIWLGPGRFLSVFWTQLTPRATNSGGPRKRPTSTPPVTAQPSRQPDLPCRLCSGQANRTPLPVKRSLGCCPRRAATATGDQRRQPSWRCMRS